MSDMNVVETYLREIGVQTPVSLVRLAHQQAQDMARPLAKHIADLPPMPALDLKAMAVAAAQCQRCTLAESRQHVVFGQGDPDADLLFVGEAPDSAEDQQAASFIGQSGSLFDAMLKAIGLHREMVYRLNIIQCHPANHRDPKQDELDACSYWLDAQIDELAPKLICVMGRVAAQGLLHSTENLQDLRGRWHDYRGIPVWVVYHPASLLRSAKKKKAVWQDLLLLQARLTAADS